MTPVHNSLCCTLCSWLWSPPEVLRNMTLWGFSARETAAVTSVEFKMTEQPRTSLPTGHTNGIVPQPRLHWRRLLSTLMEGGALRRSETREWHREKGSSGKQQLHYWCSKCVSQSLSLKFAFRSTSVLIFLKITQYSFCHALKIPSTLHFKDRLSQSVLFWNEHLEQDVLETPGSSGTLPKLLWLTRNGAD